MSPDPCRSQTRGGGDPHPAFSGSGHRLDDALIHHRVGHLEEARDVGAVHEVPRRPVPLRRLETGVVDGHHDPLQARIDEMDLPLLGVVPADERLMSFEFSGRPLVELGDDSPVYQAVAAIMAEIL